MTHISTLCRGHPCVVQVGDLHHGSSQLLKVATILRNVSGQRRNIHTQMLGDTLVFDSCDFGEVLPVPICKACGPHHIARGYGFCHIGVSRSQRAINWPGTLWGDGQSGKEGTEGTGVLHAGLQITVHLGRCHGGGAYVGLCLMPSDEDPQLLQKSQLPRRGPASALPLGC